jgi:glyoxylate reductase
VKPKVLLTRRLHDFAITELQKKYRLEIHSGKIPMPKNLLQHKISDAAGLVCFPYDKIDKKVLDAAKNLRVISTYSVGYDHIDLLAASEHKITVGYTPDVLTDATADLTVALMLDVMRRVTEGDRLIRAGKWHVIFGAHDYVGADLRGKTLGILGMGRIGRAVAKRVKPFGMNIIYHSRTPLPKSAEKKTGAKYVSMSRLVAESDVLSIHIPYSRQTYHIINKNTFKKMKKSAFLINTARGKIVDECALITALRTKQIAGAALDVFEFEPIGKNNKLTKLQNVVLAPHIGSSTEETRRKMAQIVVDNLVRGLAGKKMIYSVF